jgi:uncharacterized protein (DUF934 family)
MDAVAGIAEKYSFDELRVTHEQNLTLAHVRKKDLYAVYELLKAHDLATPNIGLITDQIACPGLDYCALANARSIPLAQQISERFADIERQHEIGELKINTSGCINACGHHHVGHIGILGVDKKGVEYYQVTLGGAADEKTAIGDIVGRAFTEDEVVDAIETIVTTYIASARMASGSSTPIAASASIRSRRAFMKLIRNGTFVEDDFITVGDGDQLPDGAAIVSLERWQAERETLRARNAPIGVRLQSGQEPGAIADDLDRIDLVALEFPVYRNGRAYSYARILRERYGFKGEVRAVGNVLRDQFQFMIRCGFDALEVTDNITPEIWAENAGSFSLFYQPSADGKETVLSLRQRLAARARENATA